MSARVGYPVTARGRLSDAERAQIDTLLAQGVRSGTIARRLGRHPATVSWYLLATGQRSPASNRKKPSSYVRNGRTIHTYSAEEDAFIEDLRVQELSPEEIARLASECFGIERNGHSVRVRLVQLGAREAGE